MTGAVSVERWREAQEAEQEYWSSLSSDARECARIIAEKVNIARWISDRIPSAWVPGEAVEIGVGPLGMGCMHFLDGLTGRVGVEPLPLLSEADLDLPAPLVAAVGACRRATGAYVAVAGEATGLQARRFSLAISYNVLDHVRDPREVLLEARRLLAPDGLLALGCDTVSLLSDFRFVSVRRRHPDSIGVRAHPFRFRLSQLEALVISSGFRILAHNRPPAARAQELVGRAHRLLVLATPAAGPEGAA